MGGEEFLPLGSAHRGRCRGASGLDQELELLEDLQSLAPISGVGESTENLGN